MVTPELPDPDPSTSLTEDDLVALISEARANEHHIAASRAFVAMGMLHYWRCMHQTQVAVDEQRRFTPEEGYQWLRQQDDGMTSAEILEGLAEKTLTQAQTMIFEQSVDRHVRAVANKMSPWRNLPSAIAVNVFSAVVMALLVLGAGYSLGVFGFRSTELQFQNSVMGKLNDVANGQRKADQFHRDLNNQLRRIEGKPRR